ncbi:MAG: hypothetical protein M1300_07480 [Epsilonproteobacteria bacterium]|nr:hypothetical protein [Campylobacterota bacterium]
MLAFLPPTLALGALNCQSGVWSIPLTSGSPIDTNSGLLNNACYYTNSIYVAFKRIGGIVYGRYYRPNTGIDSGWQSLAFIPETGFVVKQNAGSFFGLQIISTSAWGCMAYVP